MKNTKKVSLLVILVIFCSVFVSLKLTEDESITAVENIPVVAKALPPPQEDILDIASFGTNSAELGQWDLNYGEARKVQIVGTIAYVASYLGGLVILDI
ncbi:MAG: hypothetical protein ACTSQ0_08395, partial [Candidatus Heimdallarchaeota archaeon]